MTVRRPGSPAVPDVAGRAASHDDRAFARRVDHVAQAVHPELLAIGATALRDAVAVQDHQVTGLEDERTVLGHARDVAHRAEPRSRRRDALALGGTKSLPEIYAAAGARLVFDEAGMGELVALVEQRLMELRAA